MKIFTEKQQGTFNFSLALFLFLLVMPDVALAYLGPGAGLGMVGTLIAVIVAVVVGVFGIILYPVRLYRKWRKSKDVNDDVA